MTLGICFICIDEKNHYNSKYLVNKFVESIHRFFRFIVNSFYSLKKTYTCNKDKNLGHSDGVTFVQTCSYSCSRHAGTLVQTRSYSCSKFAVTQVPIIQDPYKQYLMIQTYGDSESKHAETQNPNIRRLRIQSCSSSRFQSRSYSGFNQEVTQDPNRNPTRNPA